jgi:hypothetical protein
MAKLSAVFREGDGGNGCYIQRSRLVSGFTGIVNQRKTGAYHISELQLEGSNII